jgi:hypothetical protein
MKRCCRLVKGEAWTVSILGTSVVQGRVVAAATEYFPRMASQEKEIRIRDSWWAVAAPHKSPAK